MGTSHIVVDGSNIATEGRSLPSLQQLLDAVDAVAADKKPDTITVIVDATFGHRIDKEEREAYDNKVSNGEIITPPAGVIGRGDAFILEVADRAGAIVLSNDSFQEFHGEYRWLFDEGRLLGGKHVPGVGWIFLDRSPVRGPASRKATSAANRKRKAESTKKKSSSKSSKGPANKKDTKTSTKKRSSKKDTPEAAPKGQGKEPEPYNELMPFLNFVGANEVGSVVRGEIEQFSSHGAYVMVGDTRCYIALKSMGDPPPRSARDVLTQGESRSFRVEAIDTPRRGIDLSLADGPVVAPETSDKATDDKADVEPRQAAQPPAKLITEADLEDPELSVSQRRKLRAAFAAQEAAAADPALAEEKPASKAAAKESTKRAPKKAAAKKAPAKKSSAKKAAAKKTATTKKSTAKKAATKTPAKKAAAKKSTAKKSTAKKSTAKKSTAKKSTTKKSTAKKAPAKKASTKKASAKKTPAKRATKKAPPKKS